MHQRRYRSNSPIRRAPSPLALNSRSSSSNSNSPECARGSHLGRYNPTGDQMSFYPQRASLTHTEKTRICLNPCKVRSRRHSSEMKTRRQHVSLYRAKSNIDLLVCETNLGNSTNDSLDHCRNILINGAKLKYNKILSGGGYCIAPSYISLKASVPMKEHKFRRVTCIFKPNKCRVCSENIYFHCCQCGACKLVLHKKCMNRMLAKCPKKLMPPRLALFGLSISDDSQVSDILSTCIREIEARPVHTLRGIYRYECDPKVVDNLCFSFEFGAHLVDLSKVNVHDIAGVVKEYLKRLSTPIFPKYIQRKLVQIGEEWPARKEPFKLSVLALMLFEIRWWVRRLSPANLSNLAYLMYHLRRITYRDNITEVTPNIIALAFVNIVFRTFSEESKPDGVDYINSAINYGTLTPQPGRRNRLQSLLDSFRKPRMPIPPLVRPNPTMIRINIDVVYKIRIFELMISYVLEVFCEL